MWSTTQQEAFEKVKQLVTNAPVLRYYDTQKDLMLENDASDYGIGSVMYQEGKPVAYASRSLTETERRYAQIEKEMLAVCFGLEKFHHFTFGRKVDVITDHKPLVAILGKPLSSAPKRLQSMILRTQAYNITLQYKPGTQLPVADTLSRAHLKRTTDRFTVPVYSVDFIPIKGSLLEHIRHETETDPTSIALKKIVMAGWLEQKQDISQELGPYFSYRDEISIQDGVLFRGERVVIPKSLRAMVNQKLHVGHLGINSTLRRPRP